MKIRMHTLAVLIKKDFKLLLTNKNVIIMMMLPIGFGVLYQFLFEGMLDDAKDLVLNLCVLLALTAIAVSSTGMMVAEEKEKNTLRVLMLNDVSALEYIMSKVIVIGLMTEIVCVGIYVLTFCPMHALPVFLFVTCITTCSMLMFGAIVGICSKDQMSTSTLSTPLMLLFLFPPMFSEFNEVFSTISMVLPTAAMNNIVTEAIAGGAFLTMDTLMNIGIIAAWIIISIVLFSFMYKKKSLDN